MVKNKNKKESNIAFVDGQNLYMGTTQLKRNPWKIDLKKFRIFLKDKYKVKTAYYFIGYIQECNQDLYNSIQEAGFVLSFRKHNSAMLGKKKGNVDTDIVFLAMKKVYKKDNFDKIVLVSGDGDYLRLVDFLVEEKKFKKLLSPNKKFMSSLYKKLGSEYFDFLDKKSIKNKIKTKIKKKRKK
jgi:uncharacterized LabA/DUF88 family protein